jgi:hypothetical protein
VDQRLSLGLGIEQRDERTGGQKIRQIFLATLGVMMAKKCQDDSLIEAIDRTGHIAKSYGTRWDLIDSLFRL